MSRTETIEPFSRSADRRSALDRAHIGDIRGAAGTIAAIDTGPRRTRRRQLAAMLAIAGPGLIVMAADNDAGSMSVFAQTGRSYGVGLLWVLVLLAPVLYVGQEMAARLGAVTGVGHARLIRERFGRLWCAFSVGDLLVLNFALLVTEFIGVRMSMSLLGISPGVAVPLAAVMLAACTAGGSFPRWERLMAVLIVAELVVVPLAVLHHPGLRTLATGVVPEVTSERAGSSALMLLALVGTTICPWQLFFQQSNVIDKRITPRWLRYERLDIAAGTAMFLACAGAVIILCAAVSGGAHGLVLSDAGTIAHAITARVGPTAGTGFAVALLSASLLGAVAVSLSTSYATSEVLGFKHSLHRSARDARTFHGVYALQVLAAAGIVLIPHLPLGAVTTLVQALAGILLPSALALLLMLCNDTELLGPLANPPWLNAIAATALCAVLGLSTTLTLTTVDPGIPLAASVAVAAGLLLTAGAALALAGHRARSPDNGRAAFDGLSPWERLAWSSPALERLRPPAATPVRLLALGMLRAYSAATIALLLVRLGTLLAAR